MSPQSPPESRLPGQVSGERSAVALLVPAGSPGAEHLWPSVPVGVERASQLGGGGKSAPLLIVTYVLGEWRAPRLVSGGLDHLKERPGQSGGRPALDAR